MIKNIIIAIILFAGFSSCKNTSGGTELNTDSLSTDNGLPLADTANLPLEKIKLPAGFKISIYANGIPNARSMVLSDNGILYVGNREGNKVFAVVDENKDFKADKKYIIADNMRMPNGVAIKNGDLYVAEVSKIWKFSDIDHNYNKNPKPVLIYDKFPTDDHHGWKFIAFGPDGKLYVPVGAPCNICERTDNPVYASITRLNDDGSGFEVFASGVRNSVGFAWHPVDNSFWFTDNGRDMLGDDLPSDELNCATQAGMHFGYPYCHQGDTKDPEFGSIKPCSDFTPPARNLGAHVAALGMRFYTGNMFPQEYKNQIFIAEHGSWNRTKKSGYNVSLVKLNDHQATSNEIFAGGWLDEATQNVWGRPVDVLVMPDGSLLVSDDMAGVIYRITYSQNP
ncbi:MAG: sorbosone dehydrogenase family protein [Bacteroidales bacterium]